MRRPSGLTWRGLIENVAGGVVLLAAAWLWNQFRPHGTPSLQALLWYVVAFVSGMAVIHLLRSGAANRPRHPTWESGSAPPTTEPTLPLLPVAPPKTDAAVEKLRIPYQALKEELWRNVPNRDMGNDFFILTVVLRPEIARPV